MGELKRNYKIIAVDFDGTLSLGKWPDVGPAHEKLIQYLQQQRLKGNTIYPTTSQNPSRWHPSWLNKACTTRKDSESE